MMVIVFNLLLGCGENNRKKVDHIRLTLLTHLFIFMSCGRWPQLDDKSP
jgi:hypothetical protein